MRKYVYRLWPNEVCICMLNSKRIAGVMWVMIKQDIRGKRPDISLLLLKWIDAVQILFFLI